MNWNLNLDYWDPYRQERQAKKSNEQPKYQNRQIRVNSNDKRMGRLIVTSNSKQKKKVMERKSNSKDRIPNQQKRYFHVIDNQYFAQKKQQNSRNSPSYPNYSNRRIQVTPQSQISLPRKSPIKVIKKSPPKMIFPPPQCGINTIVEAPSSIASSILKNFENNPQKLLNNLTDQKLDQIFNF